MDLTFTDQAIEVLDQNLQSPNNKLRLEYDIEGCGCVTDGVFHLVQVSEPLKGDFKGYWSRRINEEHRLVYKVIPNHVIVHSCRFHYTR